MSRGLNRERKVKAILESEDWWVVRAAGSFGDADLVALKAGKRPRLIEVKSTLGPYSHFGPADRAELLLAAEIAGGEPWLCWWPKNGSATWIPASDWPKAKAA